MQSSAWLSSCTSQNTRRYFKQTKISSVACLQLRRRFLKGDDFENLEAEGPGLAGKSEVLFCE